MRKWLIALAMVVAAPAYAQDGGIWDKYAGLICRAETIRFCKAEGACSSRPATAVFVIDFAAGTVKAAVAKQPSKILYRGHYETLGYDMITTDKHGTFAFEAPMQTSFGTPEIKAVLAMASLPESYSMWMTCYPS